MQARKAPQKLTASDRFSHTRPFRGSGSEPRFERNHKMGGGSCGSGMKGGKGKGGMKGGKGGKGK